MNTEAAILGDFERLSKVADTVAKSGLWAQFNSKDKILGLMLLCESEGLHPMAAVRRYDLIQGKPSLKAEAQLADFQKDGGRVEWIERSNTKCSGKFYHKIYCPEGVVVTWTIEDAKLAKLDQKDNYKTYPRQMLTARVITEGVQIVNPAIGLGIQSPEEVEATMESRKRIAEQVSFDVIGEETKSIPSNLPEDPKAARANRAELNKLMQPCVSLVGFKSAALEFQEKYGKEIWIEKTGHNDIETFELLAKEHKARVEENEWHLKQAETFPIRLEACTNIADFEKLEQEFLGRPQLKDRADLSDAVEAKAKELGMVRMDQTKS